MNQLHLIKAIIGTFLLKGIEDMLVLTICRHVLSFLDIRAQSPDRPNDFFKVLVDCASKLRAMPQSPPPAPLLLATACKS